jgi:enterobactin synthetase component D
MAGVIPEVLFDLVLEHGRCVGVRIPEDLAVADALGAAALVEAEYAFAAALPPLRRRTWIGGRVAMRVALARVSLEAPAVLPDARGAPMFPEGVAGSISHKGHVAVALVSSEAPLAPAGGNAPARVGVDVEVDVPSRIDVSSHVLAADEAIEVAMLDPEARAREVLLRFSAKEAIYKALDPFVRRYVAFHELSVSPDPEGGARVTSRLPTVDGCFSFEARWRRFDGIILTSARVTSLG